MKVLWGSALAGAAVLFGWLAVAQPIIAISLAAGLAWALWVYSAKRSGALAVAGTGALFIACIFPLFSLGDYGGLKLAALAAASAILLGGVLMRWASIWAAVSRTRVWLVYLAALAAVTLSGGLGAPDLLWPVVIIGAGVSLCFAGMSASELLGSGRAIILMGVAQSVCAMGEIAGVVPQLWSDGVERPSQIFDGAGRAQGTFAHPLPMALFLLACLALAPRLISSKPARVLAVAMLSIGVVMTGSRSAVVVGAVVLVLSLARRTTTRLVSGAIVLASSVAFLGQSGLGDSDVVQRFSASDSLSHRQGALDAVPGLLTGQDPWAVILGNGAFSEGHLFGAGLLQSGAFYAVDNQFVTTLVELGLLGMALLVIVVWKAARRWTSPWGMALCAMIAFFFSFDVLLWPSGVGMFAACFGAAVTTGPQHIKRQSSPRAPRGAAHSPHAAGLSQRWPEPAQRLPDRAGT